MAQKKNIKSKKSTTKIKTKDIYMMNFRVLGYQEDDKQWAAHCLETDLVGYGRTFKKALANLGELTEMQISFALFKNQPALLDNPAPPGIIEIYNTLWRTYLIRYMTNRKPPPTSHIVANLPLPAHPSPTDFSFVSA